MITPKWPEPDSNLHDPSCQFTEAIYDEITDHETEDSTSNVNVGVVTGKYTLDITTNSSYDTMMLHNMNPNACYGVFRAPALICNYI